MLIFRGVFHKRWMVHQDPYCWCFRNTAVAPVDRFPGDAGPIFDHQQYVKQTRMYQGLKIPKFHSKSPWQVTESHRERIVFQPSFFRGELLNFGRVLVHGSQEILLRLLKFHPLFRRDLFFCCFWRKFVFPAASKYWPWCFFLLLGGEVNSVIGTPEGFNQKKAYKLGPYQL